MERCSARRVREWYVDARVERCRGDDMDLRRVGSCGEMEKKEKARAGRGREGRGLGIYVWSRVDT